MQTDRRHSRKRTLALWSVGVLVLLPLIAGCGGDSTKPQPQIDVMGGILIDANSPPGGPYQAGVVVSVDGTVVTDADVRVAGAPLVYQTDVQGPGQNGFVGLVSAAEGQTVTLTVNCAAGTKTLEARVPGRIAINSPALLATFRDADDVPVSWTPASGSSLTVVTCAGAQTTNPGMWMVPVTTTTYTIPASATTPPAVRIAVLGLSGSGDMPSLNMMEWVGKNGFWITTQSSVDVVIGS